MDMENLQKIKDEHAKELGFTDFEEMFSEALHTGVEYCVDAIAIKYAKNTLHNFAKGISEIKAINGDYKEAFEIIKNLVLLILKK